jgi:trans-aconitate methyltransferase
LEKIIKDAFSQQANDRGEVELIFNRIFLVATVGV